MPASDRPDTEAAERRYEEAAAKVDLSDLAVVKRHVYTANPKEWPKPLLYALLAALASEKQRADNAQETSRLTDQQLDYMRDRLAAAEQVIATAEERADELQAIVDDRGQALYFAEERAAAAEAVIEAAQEWRDAAESLADEAFQRYAGSDTPRLTDLCEDIFRLAANYHKATGPQAENHLDVELLRVHAEGFGNGGPVGKPEVTTAEESEHPTD